MCVPTRQEHPVELCARMQTVFDLRNAATRDTLCNYDGANRQTQVSCSQRKISGSGSSTSMHCFLSHILLQSKIERKEQSQLRPC